MSDPEHINYLRYRFGWKWPIAWLMSVTLAPLMLRQRRKEIEKERIRTCEHKRLDSNDICLDCGQDCGCDIDFR